MYKKAFDSEQIQAILTSLQEQGIEGILPTPRSGSMTVYLYNESNKINTRRGVWQADTISPKLFTAALESIF